MRARREIWEVARRELVERWRSRAMRVSSAILLVLVVAGAVALTLADDSTPTDDFGLVGARAAALAPALRLAGVADDREMRIRRLRDREEAERAVRDGDVDVAIVDGRLVVEEDRSAPAVGVAQRAIAAQATLARLEAAGLTREQALEALAQRPQPVVVLEPGAREREREEGMLWVGMLLLFTGLIVYGQAVASSVAEEKSSRVIELLLTSLAPGRLMAGKVVGVGTLGVAQLAVVSAAGLLGARTPAAKACRPAPRRPSGSSSAGSCSASPSTAWPTAALGALVSRQEDLEATTAPVNVLLIGAYLAAMAAISDPDGTWAEIAAFLPPLAPMIVPTRVVLGDMGTIGLAAAVAIELLATFALIRVAAGIYERSVLRIGAPISLRSALRMKRRPPATRYRRHQPPAPHG